MKVSETCLNGVLLLEPAVFSDKRGWFMETYSLAKFKQIGIGVDFVQDNHSFSQQKGILRGLHFQNHPMAQSKLIRCSRGRILDVAVDLRKGSPTYKQYMRVELSEDNKLQLFIPQGFGHGFLTLSDNVEVQYKCDKLYSKEHDRSIRFDDPELNIDWPEMTYTLSEKDIQAPTLAQSDVNFYYAKGE
jgi:dTDP-4-dehydrorhamnose 3,5-epimerase